MDGSKLKTPHLVRGVHVFKETNCEKDYFVLMEGLEYAALLEAHFFPPSGLLK